MKKHFFSLYRIIASLIVMTFVIGYMSVAVKAEQRKQVDILFTHDLHSYLESYEIEEKGNIISVGGFARLKTVVDQKLKENPDTLIVDAGDIAMGTLYQTMFEKEALEMVLLGELGIEATTFGNHEFDFGSEALANMFRRAKAKTDKLPMYLVCNIDFSSDNPGSQDIYSALQEFGYQEYMVVEKDGVKIAITGVLGYDAYDCAPTCELTWLDPIDSLKKTVKKIKENEDVDMIVCLSHSGVSDDPKKSEDEKIAKAVPELDVIISAHAHIVLRDGIKVGDTNIVSCGNYGRYTGTVHFVQNKDGRWNMQEYNLIDMNADIEEDQQILDEIKAYDEEINNEYLSSFGYEADQVIGHTDFSFEDIDDLYNKHTEMKLGNFLADAYKYAANFTPIAADHPVDVTVVPAGTVRGTFLTGDITVKKAFESFSLGRGKDGSIGYPLIATYVSGKELKTVAEMEASLSDIMNSARMYTSGLSFEYNPNRLILNKVSDVWLSPAAFEESRSEIVDDELYLIVTDYYSGQMLESVTRLSKGILSVVLKDADGNPVESLDDLIVYKEDGTELKAWVAIADYIGSFSKNQDGISQIPAYYNEFHDRKVVNEEKNFKALFGNPSRYFIAIIIIIITLIVLIIVITRVIIVIRSHKRVFGKDEEKIVKSNKNVKIKQTTKVRRIKSKK